MNKYPKQSPYTIELFFNDKRLRRTGAQYLFEAQAQAERLFALEENATHYRITFPDGIRTNGEALEHIERRFCEIATN